MRHQRISQEESYLCRCSTTFPVDQKTTKKNVRQMPNSYLCTREDLEKGQWSYIGPGSEKKWYCISEDSPLGVWDNIAEKMLFEFAESGCPIFRATSPLSRGQLKSKGHGKLSIHCAADLESVETIFRMIVSANQLSLYGAVAEICEEYESHHERMGRTVVREKSSSSLVQSVIKTEVPLDCDDPANQDLLLQQYGERIEKLSQQDKLSKFCMDAGFLSVVENGQYFMTKDTGDLTHFHAVACREYTLPRGEPASPKGWIQGNTKDWARISSCNQLFARWVWTWHQNLVFAQRQHSWGILLGHPLFAERNIGRRYSDCWDWRIGKYMPQKHIPEDWLRKKSW